VWVWVVVGLFSVACLGCVGIVVAGSFAAEGAVKGIMSAVEPVMTTTSFYENLQEGDYDAAHDLLGSQLAAIYPPDVLQARWEDFESEEGSLYSHVPDMDQMAKSSKASVTEQLYTSGGSTFDVELSLERAGGDWKIVGASPSLIP
jgi:hypothetical protein